MKTTIFSFFVFFCTLNSYADPDSWAVGSTFYDDRSGFVIFELLTQREKRERIRLAKVSHRHDQICLSQGELWLFGHIDDKSFLRLPPWPSFGFHSGGDIQLNFKFLTQDLTGKFIFGNMAGMVLEDVAGVDGPHIGSVKVTIGSQSSSVFMLNQSIADKIEGKIKLDMVDLLDAPPTVRTNDDIFFDEKTGDHYLIDSEKFTSPRLNAEDEVRELHVQSISVVRVNPKGQHSALEIQTYSRPMDEHPDHRIGSKERFKVNQMEIQLTTGEMIILPPILGKSNLPVYVEANGNRRNLKFMGRPSEEQMMKLGFYGRYGNQLPNPCSKLFYTQ